MHTVPQYMTMLIRKDGEEFGVFYYGDRIKKFLSVFPSDLFQHGACHDSVDQAIEYMGTVWQSVNNIVDNTAFAIEMVRQREHVAVVNYCGTC